MKFKLLFVIALLSFAYYSLPVLHFLVFEEKIGWIASCDFLGFSVGVYYLLLMYSSSSVIPVVVQTILFILTTLIGYKLVMFIYSLFQNKDSVNSNIGVE
ncbi:MAG TPA: hypothetical protein ENH82_17560 [bacterium]|nr:hypothetical protein [bacterium]